MLGVVRPQRLDERVDMECKEEARCMNMNRACVFVFTRLELVLFITVGL